MADNLYVRYHGAWVPLTQIHLIGGTDYHPIIWNDAGVYDCFYIDFKAHLLTFKLTTFNKCMIILGKDGLLTPTKVETTANPNIYRVILDISAENRGITVANIKPGLVLSTAEDLPFFSEFFYVSGLVPVSEYEMYDATEAVHYRNLITYCVENASVNHLYNLYASGSETVTVPSVFVDHITENATVTLL